uniref:uncharacterized protein LOC122608343 n=1 Tax=Erigeron canadensis TaxID=72917 RepID=UPI001CB9AE21|nr:uncharacterized protein LOC122608343 [Erigeron canadensis]
MPFSTLNQQDCCRNGHLNLKFFRLVGKRLITICGFARHEPRVRPWADLPPELLSSIADRLTIIDLLSFRGTCKDFRSASSTASAEIELSRSPWLLFHKPNTSECHIYNEHESKTYKRNIPDLEGATCLASYQGWLLVFREETLFFFNPFSLAKIALPDFPHKQIDGHVATFSDVPTSPHCIVSIVNSTDENYVEVNFISRGENAWTKYKERKPESLSHPIVTTTFDKESQTFYYADAGKYLLTFSVKDGKFTKYRYVQRNMTEGVKPLKLNLPYRVSENVFRDTFEKKRCQLDLEDDEYVAACGLTYKLPKTMSSQVYSNEAVDVSAAKTRVRRAVWIQPRFFEPDPNHQW